MAEQDMYRPIEKAFENLGFVSFPEFSFEHPLIPERQARVDVAAFRWRNDVEIDARAVEAKEGAQPATPLRAVSQAAIYQLLFPSVYVAGRVPRDDLAFSEGALRTLGLGYIRVRKKKVSFIFEPVEGTRCYRELFLEQIRPAAVLSLLAEELSGKEQWTSNKKANNFWIWTSAKDKVQLQLGVDRKYAYFGLWTEIKKVCHEIAENADPEELASLLRHVPRKYKRCHHVAPVKKLPSGGKESLGEGLTFDDSVAGVKSALDRMRKWCAGQHRVGVLAIRYVLWKRTRSVSRTEAITRTRCLLGHLAAIREYVNASLH